MLTKCIVKWTITKLQEILPTRKTKKISGRDAQSTAHTGKQFRATTTTTTKVARIGNCRPHVQVMDGPNNPQCQLEIGFGQWELTNGTNKLYDN